MRPRTAFRRVLTLLVLLVTAGAAAVVWTQYAPRAEAAAKTVWIPERWQSTGEVPWAQNRTKESTNFILLWGEKSGTDPKSAPADVRFDPDNILSQLETLYGFYINTMRFTTETGLLAQHKIIANTGTTAVNGWTLTGTFPNGQQVTNAWNATVTVDGATLNARDAGYNGAIAPGSSVSFGFLGTHSGTNGTPTGWSLNGNPCTT